MMVRTLPPPQRTRASNRSLALAGSLKRRASSPFITESCYGGLDEGY